MLLLNTVPCLNGYKCTINYSETLCNIFLNSELLGTVVTTMDIFKKKKYVANAVSKPVLIIGFV